MTDELSIGTVGCMTSRTPSQTVCEYVEMSRIKLERMVGRREELSVLLDLEAETHEGSSHVTLISGEAGIGKTRLIDEFLERVDGGSRTIVGRCDALGDAAPVAAISDLFRHVSVDEVPQGAVGAFSAVLEGRGESIAPLGLCEGVMRFVEDLAEQRPLLMIIEDLHWADATTRNVVGFVARRLASLPVLLIITYRSDELHRRHPLRPFLTELDRSVHPTRIELEPLDRGELAELAEGIMGVVPGSALLDGMSELSGGNPFFAEELIAARPQTLPSSIREVVRGRIANLGEAQLRVLRLASVGSNTIDPQVLAAVADVELDQVRGHLRRLVDHQHLVKTDEGLAFRHALSREVVYDDLLPGERTALHASFASVLASISPDRIGEIAHHLSMAGDQNGSFRSSIAAGDDASSRGAQAEGLIHYERALSLWKPQRAEGVIAHHDLVLRAAKCAIWTRNFDRAIHLLESEISDGDLTPAQLVDVSKTLATSRWHANRSDVLEPLDEVLTLLTGPSLEMVDVLAQHSYFLTQAGRTNEALKDAKRAVAMADTLEDDTRSRLAEERLNLAELENGGIEHLHAAEAAVDRARTSGDLTAKLRAGTYLGHVANRLGAFDRTLAISDELVPEAIAAGTYLSQGVSFWNTTVFGLWRKLGAGTRPRSSQVRSSTNSDSSTISGSTA